MKGDLIYFDIETSGLDPFEHEIIEVGYVIEDKCGDITETREFSVPFDLARASEKALEVNGWGQREFAPEMRAVEAATEMGFAFGGATMVVNSLQFDLTFTSVFLRRYAPALNSTPWSHRSVDLKSVTAGKLGISLDRLTTGGIMRHFGLTNASAHTALGDALFNRNWYHALELYRG